MALDIEALTGTDKSDLNSVIRKATGLYDPLTIPAVSQFTWVNQGTATAVDDGDGSGVYIQDQLNNANSIAALVKALPGTTFTAEMLFDFNSMCFANMQQGICLRESATGKLAVLQTITNSSNFDVLSAKYTNPTTFSADFYWHTARYNGIPPKGFKLTGNGATTAAFVTYDGVHWIPYGSTTPTLATHFTTAPDQVGFFVNNSTAGQGALTAFKVGMKVKHFKVS